MKHSLSIVFGKEQVLKVYNNETLSNEEIKLYVKDFQFNSLQEKLAFMDGLNAGHGWVDFCIPEIESLSLIPENKIS